MKYIELTKGKKAIVDDEDYDFLNQWNWQFIHGGYASGHLNDKSHPRDNNGKFIIKSDKSVFMYMHRLIMKAPPKIEIDHINGNKLDNRKNNLRVVTKQQNAANAKIGKNNTSGYKGVTRHRNKWIAQIMVNHKRIYLGIHDDKTKAAKEYNKAAIKYFGQYSKLNNI